MKILVENPDFRFFDQDALNTFFANNFVRLPVKFDCIFFRKQNKKAEQEIYHYCGIDQKPCPDFKSEFNRLWFSYFIKTPFFNLDLVSNMWNGFEWIINDTYKRVSNRMNRWQRICKLSANHLRAFYCKPEEVDKIRELFGNDPRDLFFNSSNPKSLDVLIQDIKDFPDKRIYLLNVDDATFKEMHAKLVNKGSDFFNIRQLFEDLPIIARGSRNRFSLDI